MMKRLMWVPVMALGLGIAVLYGCGEKAEQAKEQAQETTQKAVEAAKEMGDKANEAVESAGAWSKEKMGNYIGEMKKQLGNYDAQFEEFSAKAEGMDDDAKEKFKEQSAAVTEKKSAIAMKMEELQTATGEAWDKAKAEIDKLMAELAQLYEDIKKDFSTS